MNWIAWAVFAGLTMFVPWEVCFLLAMFLLGNGPAPRWVLDGPSIWTPLRCVLWLCRRDDG